MPEQEIFRCIFLWDTCETLILAMSVNGTRCRDWYKRVKVAVFGLKRRLFRSVDNEICDRSFCTATADTFGCKKDSNVCILYLAVILHVQACGTSHCGLAD